MPSTRESTIWGTLQVCDDLDSLSRVAADLFVAQAQAAIDRNGRFTVALAGGGTPRHTYELLVTQPYRSRFDWSRVEVFWGDERCVPSDDERNNANMATQAWLGQSAIPPQQRHAIQGTGDPRDSAAAYERTLRTFFTDDSSTFDLVFLGLGENGHTASLFPGTPVLAETERWVADVYVSEQDMHRITLTAPLLNRSELIVFLVSGQSKSATLRDVLEGPFTPEKLPAQLIQPRQGKLLWLADRPAAELLGDTNR